MEARRAETRRGSVRSTRARSRPPAGRRKDELRSDSSHERAEPYHPLGRVKIAHSNRDACARYKPG